MICNSYVFQKEFFSIQKNIKQLHRNCVSFCLFTSPFLFYFIFLPYLGHQQLRFQKAFFSLFQDGLQTLMNKLQACHETWTQGRFPGFSFQSDLAHGSGSEDCFSFAAGMGNPLVQRKKRWKVDGLQCGKSSCRAGSLPLLLKPGLVLCCSSHQLWLDCCGPP